jgi:hypothetical protein
MGNYVGPGKVQIMHIAFLSQFPLREHIPQVLGNHGTLSAE